MLRHYLILATKVLLRRKFFTFISLFGIAFTLVVLVVVSALMDHSLAAEAPESRQDLMLGVHAATQYGDKSGERIHGHGGFKLFDRYARNLPGVEHLTIFTNSNALYSFVDGRKVTSVVKRTDGAFWKVFDFTFREGGPYSAADVDNAAFVAVLSDAARQRLLRDTPAIGAHIDVDGQRFRVVGVVDDVSEVRFVPFSDIWVPYTTAKTPAYRDAMMGGFQAVALATDRNSLQGIRDEFNSRLLHAELSPGFDHILAPFDTKFEFFAREMRLGGRNDADSHAGRLALLIGTAAFLFALLPTVNLINLNVSRIMERASEIGVRKAFGASSRTLVGQFIVENVLLTLVGAGVSFVVSFFLLRAINDSGLIAHAHLTLNARVFAMGVGMALVFGVLSGVYPAWRMSRLRPIQALKGAQR